MNSYRANGKFMISGEYVVLAGARVLALPLKKGQNLHVEINALPSQMIEWNSFFNGIPYLKIKLLWPDLTIENTSDQEKGDRLVSILKLATSLHPGFRDKLSGTKIISQADFNPQWGMGSSSTLISNIARWAEVNPFVLNAGIFNGSGYDIACAQSDSALIYELKEGLPVFQNVDFKPAFRDRLFFLYSGRKQDTKSEIGNARLGLETNSTDRVSDISDLTNRLIGAHDLHTFERILKEHDRIISEIIRKETVYERYFKGYHGYIKYMGAWGGDFYLATWHGRKNMAKKFFSEWGMDTVFSYDEIVL